MKLCRLEWRKIRLSTYLWAVSGIFAGLLSIGILFLFILRIEEGGGAAGDMDLFESWNGLLALTTALAFACFSIFSAVIAAKVVVDEYCGKHAVILLSYPVDRKKILRAKCLIVTGITTTSAFFSNVLVAGIMYLSAHIFGVMPQMDTEHFFLTVMLSSFFMGTLSSAAGMISAAFGWKKRSVIATVVCALLLVCVSANCITIFPGGLIWVMLAMSAVFLMTAALACHALAAGIRKMEV